MNPKPLSNGNGGNNHDHIAYQKAMLRRGHSLLLLLAALYISWAYPAATGPVMLVASGALLAEWLPFAWRRLFIPEIILLNVGLLSYAWTVTLDQDLGHYFSISDNRWAFAGWIRMIMVFWALVPSRLHMAQIFAALVGGEILLLAGNEQALEMRHGLFLLPLMLVALGLHEWLRQLANHKEMVSIGRSHHASPWYTLAALAMIIGLIAFAFTRFAVSYRDQQNARGQQEASQLNETQQRDLTTSIGLGDDSFSDQDPSLAAQLILPDGMTLDESMVYLRALTTPELWIHDDGLRWRSAGEPRSRFSDIPLLHPQHELRMATLFRARGSGDLVLRPDHSAQVEIHGMIADEDGNLYRSGLGEFPRRYSVDLGAERSPPATFADENNQRNLQLPDAVAQLLRENIPEIERWRNLPVAAAAASIRDYLHRRSSYALHDLPDPLPGVAGDLRGFLLGAPHQRLGHCQYFTTAHVTLLRASGHQARPVIGFASDEFNAEGVVFRALHAHAWSEYRSAIGLWQRYDATPASGLAQRNEGITEEQLEQPWDEARSAEDLAESASKSDARHWWWASLLLAPLIGAALWWRFHKHSPQRDPKLRQLAKYRDELLRCASDCGVSINASTTLTEICQDLSQRSGVDLAPLLREHLAARFGNGPLPKNWPIKTIREAYREKQGHHNQESG